MITEALTGLREEGRRLGLRVTLPAIEAVCMAEVDLEGEVLDWLGWLVDKSLLQPIPGHAEEPRVARALAALKRRASLYRVLGSYPRAVQ